MSQFKTESAPLAANENTGDANGVKSGTLAAAGIFGVLASACCIGPLVLVSIGLSGAAGGLVAAFTPLRPVFIVIALAALAFAGWKIYRRPVAECGPGSACAVPQTARIHKTVFSERPCRPHPGGEPVPRDQEPAGTRDGAAAGDRMLTAFNPDLVGWLAFVPSAMEPPYQFVTAGVRSRPRSSPPGSPPGSCIDTTRDGTGEWLLVAQRACACDCPSPPCFSFLRCPQRRAPPTVSSPSRAPTA